MNGIINVIKPPGMTSSGIVVFLRRILGEDRVGHTGTLDPAAAGVLPICVGKSTRLSPIIMDHKKTYIAEVLFGVTTDTLDSAGAVIEKKPCRVGEDELRKTLEDFTGELMQTPPAYSAVKIDGRTSYELARKGVIKEKPPRPITIYENSLIQQMGENRFLLRVTCSKGTYIRKLADDMARRLNTRGCLTFLLRQRSGGYVIDDGFTLDEIADMKKRGDTSFLQPPQSAVSYMPKVICKNKFAIDHGMTLAGDYPQEGFFRVYCDGVFYGLGQAATGGYKLTMLLKD